jgi:hypothetical protein
MTSDAFQSLATGFEKISLEQMDSVSFLSRLDTKYLMDNDTLLSVMKEMQPDYYILEVDGIRDFTYYSQYVDTHEFSMYFAHHNKRKNRYKCRMRIYENTGLTFWEIKHKTNHGITKKKRIKISSENVTKEEINSFVNKNLPFNFDILEPKLVSHFHRMTFVNKGLTERVTIDRNLSWSNSEKEIDLDGLAMVEVKNESKATLAKLYPILRKYGIRPGSFSKYTFGCALIYSDLKQNLLKKKLIYLNKFCHASAKLHTNS